MSEIDPEFLKELQDAFALEAADQLQAIMTDLLELESAQEQNDKLRLTEEILHNLHSMKGNGRAAGFIAVETLCQEFESALLSLKRRGKLLEKNAADVMQKAVDVLDSLIGGAGADSTDFLTVLRLLEELDERKKDQIEESLTELVAQAGEESEAPANEEIKSDPPLEKNIPAQPVKPAVVPTSPSSDRPPRAETGAETRASGTMDSIGPQRRSTDPSANKRPGAERQNVTGERAASVRMPLWKLDRLLREAEEMLVVKQISEQHVEDSSEMRHYAKRLSAECRRFASVLKKTSKGTDVPQEVAAFASWLNQFSNSLESKVSGNLRRQQQEQRVCGNLVDGFLDSVKSLLMQDFSGLLSVIPKMVRDLSRELGKDVELEIFGTDIEIDRRILEEIKDPLIHLIRNSLDHGIEPPAARLASGKRAAAQLRVGAIQTGDGQVELVIHDDGRGISTTKVKEAAIREGVLTAAQAEALTKAEALELIYRSSVSTSEKVTEISGRGLGMAIVRERIHDLGGRIILETEEGQGTVFRLQLPVKLSTFRGIHVKAGGLSFIVPTLNVHHAGRVRLSEISSSGTKNVIKAEGQLVAVQFLTDALRIAPSADRTRELHQLLVIGTNSERTGFLVDEILQEHEVLVRPFTPPLLRVPNFSGATVLGTGSVLPVVNMADLLKTAQKAKWADEALSHLLAERSARLERLARSPIYIIDRPTTSRVMVKTLLESEGYKVKTYENVAMAAQKDNGEIPILILKSAQSALDLRIELDDMDVLEQTFRSTPIMLFGTQPAGKGTEFALSAGARGYINTLDFERDEVVKLVKTVL